jgi:hypothetical protein
LLTPNFIDGFDPPAARFRLDDRRSATSIKSRNDFKFWEPGSKALKTREPNLCRRFVFAMFTQGLPLSVGIMKDSMQWHAILDDVGANDQPISR